MTFSVVFHDRETGTWGVGVASKFISVGSVVPWAKAGVGAIATQAYANYSYGPNGLELLKEKSADEVLRALISGDDGRESRQLAIVDSKGNVSAHTGKECMDFAGHITGDGYSVQGNILAGREVIESMAKEMDRGGEVIDRVIRALEAADSRGGDRRGRQSAAILITTLGEPAEMHSDMLVDLRVDDSEEPIREIRRMSLLWEATFFDQDMIDISDNKAEIDAAISRTRYGSVEEWAANNNFSDRVKDGKIGSRVLKALVSGSRGSW